MAYEWILLFEIPLLAGLIAVATQSGFFVPLPMSTIRKLLKLSKVRRNDLFYDLGCGDGRVIITAAKEHNAKSMGIERSPILYWLSKWNINKNKLSGKVKLVRGDFFKHNLSKADVIFVYLTPRLNRKLKPKLEGELKRGTRVISASHKFKGWKEVRKIKTGHFNSYLYRI